ncbi:unnamed protein product [Allacma fusca]|uniref:S1 motif domain-containing protein n=1 Tax=Allacma fusca TaxID=39272 RepID=A0A8J2LKH9_9HEXA|nr:unnamed protein product [Allacma fusca]
MNFLTSISAFVHSYQLTFPAVTAIAMNGRLSPLRLQVASDPTPSQTVCYKSRETPDRTVYGSAGSKASTKMVKAKEIDFPRGQVPKSGSNSSRKKKTQKAGFLADLFHEEVPSLGSEGTASKKKKTKNALTSEENELLAGKEGYASDKFGGDLLSYDTISEGVLSLGRVSQVQNGKLVVNLPCRVVGEISLLDVSRPYQKIMHNLASGVDVDTDAPWCALEDMFWVGQLISVAVKEVKDLVHIKKIILSSDPWQLHKNYNCSNITNGMILTAAVESVEDHGYIMDVGINNTRAFLSTENAVKFIKSANRGKALGVGQLVSCQVIQSKITNNMCNVQLTADPKSIHKYKYADELNFNYSLLLPGMLMNGVVMEAYKGGLKIHVMDLEGFVHKDHLPTPWTSPTTYEISSSLTARILYVLPNGSNPYLSLQPNLYPHNIQKKDDRITLGTNQEVKVVRIDKTGVIIRFEKGQKGLVSLRRCSDDASCTIEELKKQFSVGSSHTCKVLEFNNMDTVYIASFKQSMLEQKAIRVEQIEPGIVVKCTVKFWKAHGAVVTFGLLRGFIPVLHFGNIPIRNPSAKFPPQSSFKAKVVKLNVEKNQIQLTAKKDLVKNEFPVLTTLEKVTKGTISKGVVVASNKGGVIIETVGGLKGFAPLKFLAVEKGAVLNTLFFPGRILTFQVLFVEPEKKKLILSLIIKNQREKDIEDSSDVEVEQTNTSNAAESNSEGSLNPKRKRTVDTEVEQPKKKKKAKKEQEKNEDSEVVDEKGNLKLPVNSFWDLQDSDNEAEPSSKQVEEKLDEAKAAANGVSSKKLTKKEKRKLKEQQIRDAELALADSNVTLKTEDDYERVILASPNSSMCWIQFMAHYLQQGEVAKAKEVGIRALKMILFREEQERFNVWVALLNLENSYGTPESLATVLQEAKQNNDDYKIASTMAEIFCQSKKTQEADEIYQKMVKKYRNTPDACIKYGKFLYRNKRYEDARELFKKTLLQMDRAHHVQLISKYSQFELELGERERGCTLFDQLLGTYPKRIDIWLVYANTLAKIEDYDNAKNVLIRAIESRFPPKKSKPLFTRLFEIDKQCPNPDPDAIRQLAVDYTTNIVVNSNSCANIPAYRQIPLFSWCSHEMPGKV